MESGACRRWVAGENNEEPSITLGTYLLLRTSAGLQVNRSPQPWPGDLAWWMRAFWLILRLLGQIYFTFSGYTLPGPGLAPPHGKASVGGASWDQLPGMGLGRRLGWDGGKAAQLGVKSPVVSVTDHKRD